MIAPDLQTWLDANGIDIQTIEPEIEKSLLARFEAEQQVAPKPVTEAIVLSDDWPRRTYRQPTQGALFDCSEQYQ